jgi:hypothetical protein
MHTNSLLEINAGVHRERMMEQADRERLIHQAALNESSLTAPEPAHHSPLLVLLGKAILWPLRMVRRAVFFMPSGR